MIAYVGPSPGGGPPNIFTIRSDGSRPTQLTATGGAGPDWSPDGSRLAFWHGTKVGVMSADGSTRDWVADGSQPAWSPDGQRLSYRCAEEGGEGGLCVVDLRTGAHTVLVSNTPEWISIESSDWSPDGSLIAFTRYSSEGDDYTRFRQLFVVRPDGSGLRPVPNTFPTGTSPAWSPDGSRLLYTERYDGRGGEFSGDVWSIRPDGTGREAVLRQPGRDDDPAWAPDGQRIAVTSAAIGYPRMQGVWTMSPTGGRRDLVVRGGRDPSWRPAFTAPPQDPAAPPEGAGRLISYVAATGQGFDLFVARPDGTQRRRLSHHGRVQEPAWSPDHTRIAYVVGQESVRVVNIRTGLTREVAKSLTASGVTWSPSGDRLAWGRFDGLVVYNLRTNTRRIIPVGPGCCGARDPSWSPDGRRLVFSQNQRTFGAVDLMTVAVSGKDLRPVTSFRGAELEPAWSPDGRTILFTHEQGRSGDRTVDVMSVRPNGSNLRTVLATHGLDYSPSWSPSGDRMALYSDGRRPFGASPRPGVWILGSNSRRQLVIQDRTVAYVDW